MSIERKHTIDNYFYWYETAYVPEPLCVNRSFLYTHLLNRPIRYCLVPLLHYQEKSYWRNIKSHFTWNGLIVCSACHRVYMWMIQTYMRTGGTDVYSTDSDNFDILSMMILYIIRIRQPDVQVKILLTRILISTRTAFSTAFLTKYAKMLMIWTGLHLLGRHSNIRGWNLQCYKGMLTQLQRFSKVLFVSQS